MWEFSSDYESPKEGKKKSIWDDEDGWGEINEAAGKEVDSFFGKRYKSSLGWSKSKLSDTTSYKWGGSWGSSSKFRSLDKDAKIYELLKKAYADTRDMIIILDFPFNVYIQTSIHHNPVPKNDKTGRKIVIPTKVIDDASRDDDTKIVVICGLGIHEAAHLKFTELRVIEKFEKGLRDGGLNDKEIKLALMMVNLIEDSRIENKLLEERPGYAEFFDRTNDWKFEELDKNFKSSSIDPEVIEFLKNVVSLVCFPSKLSREFVSKYESSFSRFKDIVYPLPKNTKGSCMKGFELYKAIREEFKHFDIPESELDGSMTLLSESIDKSIPLSMPITGSDCDSNETALSSRIVTGSESEFEKLAAESLSDEQSVVSELLSGDVELGTSKKILFKKVNGRKDRYNRIKSSISKYIPTVKKAVKGVDKNYDFVIHGCRSGLLDTSKLVEAIQGVPQVYLRQGHVKTTKTTVCVLVDESGSMCGDKIELARQAAVLLNESLKDAGVDLYIYGHSADEVYGDDTYLRIYKERGTVDQFAVSEIAAHDQNRDGSAIREVANRVRKFTDSRCLFFVISDGAPCASGYWGGSAMRDVKSAVNEIEGKGFDVIQITIDGGMTTSQVKKYMGFKHVIDLRDSLKELPKQLSKLVKKAVMENKKTTTEM